MAATNQLKLTFEIVGNDIKTLNDKIKALVESVGSSTPDTIKETIDNQTNDIRDVVGALLIKVNQLNEHLKDMSKEPVHDYSGEIQQLTTQLNSIAEQINGLSTKATQDINGLTTQVQSANTSIGDLSNRVTTIENKPVNDSSIKTAYDSGAILLSGNLNKTLCVVPKNWKLLFIDWRDGNNTSWSTYTGIVINKGGFFQWRFQNCPFALQINGAGELKCYSLDSGKEAFIKSVQYQE